jgi:enoyl-CoA hydratase/carnithine racemase
MTPAVHLDIRDRVAYLTLNRPEALNAIDEDVIAGLAEALESAALEPGVKAVVITGAGDAFSVGLDIDLLGRAFDELAYFRDVLDRFKELLLAVQAMPVPVVAAVNGLARAGGFELILACDLAIVAEDARIGDTHVAFGLLPGGGATVRAPRRLGDQRARELLLTGRWMTGVEAADAGLALRAVAPTRLYDEIEELIAQFRPLSRAALSATKGALEATADLPLTEALEVELEHFVRLLEKEPSAREGYQAFVEKPSRAITDHDLNALIGIGGYTHPLFTDPEFAAASRFGKRPMPGQAVLLLMGGLVEQSGRFDDTVIALTGFDEVRFTSPCFPGDDVHVEIEVLDKEQSDGRGTLIMAWRALIGGPEPTMLCEARARMLFRRA